MVAPRVHSMPLLSYVHCVPGIVLRTKHTDLDVYLVPGDSLEDQATNIDLDVQLLPRDGLEDLALTLISTLSQEMVLTPKY
jgi:hypothetical protein